MMSSFSSQTSPSWLLFYCESKTIIQVFQHSKRGTTILRLLKFSKQPFEDTYITDTKDQATTL